MPRLNAAQNVFLNGLGTKYRAYVGGFGSGKTFVGCLDLINFMLKHPGTKTGYFGPSYPAIRDIFYPTFEEAAELLGFRVEIVASNKEIHLFWGRRYYGTVICRSMDNPSTIVGYKIARALCDEIDTLPENKAEQAWRKIEARLRLKIDGVVNGVGVTTTPEGFGFCYKHFYDAPKSSYSMVQASTYENAEYLPDDYISTLEESYPENLIGAYLNGEFVNLAGKTVYVAFNRRLCDTDIEHKPDEPLYIGMDFNVGNMSAVVHVKRPGGPVAVDEITEGYDTPDMIQKIIARYPKNRIYVYPDASGAGRRSTDASKTDISQLEDYFTVCAGASNPRVRDRVNSVNAAFKNGYRVNVNKCPSYTLCLEKQIYDKKGEPDKTQGNDHLNDAAGYFICRDYPIIKPVASTNIRMSY